MKRLFAMAISALVAMMIAAPAAVAGTPDHASVPDGRGIPQVENCSFWRSVTTCETLVELGSETVPVEEACGDAGTRYGTYERTDYELTVTQHKGAPNSNGKLLSSETSTFSENSETTWGECIERAGSNDDPCAGLTGLAKAACEANEKSVVN